VSSYRGNGEECPGCGVRYGDFRTGLTYRDVYAMEYTRKWKRRRTILGAWHEYKRRLWAQHLEECDCTCTEVPF
jgi:hypothetical protein